MRKIILIYGLCLAILVFVLQYIDYRYMVHRMSLEAYVGVISVICTALGIWMGLKLTNPKAPKSEALNLAITPAVEPLKTTNISHRELEVLQLMAQGHSNKEIAEQLFISLPTVKTHGSRLFAKLKVKRRTQAVREAQRIGILP